MGGTKRQNTSSTSVSSDKTCRSCGAQHQWAYRAKSTVGGFADCSGILKSETGRVFFISGKKPENFEPA